MRNTRKYMHIAAIAAAALLAASCGWTKTTDVHSMQPALCDRMVGWSNVSALGYLGQPSEVRTDTVAGVPILVMSFRDSVSLKEFTGFDERFQEAPYIDLYLKDWKVYSVKSNIVVPEVKRDMYKLSIVRLTVYASILLFLLVLACVAYLQKRTGVMMTMAEKVDAGFDYYLKAEDKFKAISGRIDSQQTQINRLGAKIETADRTLGNYKTRLRLLEQKAASPAQKEPAGAPATYTYSFDEFRDLLTRPLSDLGLTVRTFNGLKGADIDNLEALCLHSREEIAKIRNFGGKSLKEVDALLARYGLSYGTDYLEYISGSEGESGSGDKESEDNKNEEI